MAVTNFVSSWQTGQVIARHAGCFSVKTFETSQSIGMLYPQIASCYKNALLLMTLSPVSYKRQTSVRQVFDKCFEQQSLYFSTNRKMDIRLSVVVMMCAYVMVCGAISEPEPEPPAEPYPTRVCHPLVISECFGKFHVIPSCY